MKGKILDYSVQNSSGIISGNDGNRYNFINKEWKSDKSPMANQLVDFDINENNAIAIYLDATASSFNADELKEKMADFKNSDTVKNAQSNINDAINDGVQNKFGFRVSVMIAIALFFPVVSLPFSGSLSLLDGGLGKILFVGLIIISGLFYVGASKRFVKIGVGIVSAIILMQFYDLLSTLNQSRNMMNLFGGNNDSSIFSLLKFGTYILIPLTFVLLFSGFKAKYIEKEK